jgi:hypothetical protein
MIVTTLLQLVLAAFFLQGPGCAAANDLFERTKARFDADRASTTMTRDAAQGYLEQFRRVVDLCPGNGAGWNYAYEAATFLKDPRANFYRSQAELHDYHPEASPAPIVVAAKPRFDLSVRITKDGKDVPNGLLKEGEAFKLAANIKNTGNATASGVRIKVSGFAPVKDAVGDEQYVGDLAGGEERAVELSGTIGNVIQETGSIQVEAADLSGARSDSRTFTLTVSPAVDINKLPPEVTPDPRAFAVVVGIGKYRSPQIPAIEYATSDADLMAEYLRVFAGVPRTNIRKLIDETATKSDLDAAFEEWLPQRVTAGSRVYVYFAGHGSPLVGADGLPSQNLVPFDARPESALSFLRLNDLYDRLEKLKVASTYVFLDTCFSGSGRSFPPPNTRMLVVDGPPQTDKVIVFTASKNSEPSNDFPAVHHGLFTYFLFRGLYGEADKNKDQSITVEELFSYVSSSVSAAALRTINRPQTPTLMPEGPSLGNRAAGIIASSIKR